MTEEELAPRAQAYERLAADFAECRRARDIRGVAIRLALDVIQQLASDKFGRDWETRSPERPAPLRMLQEMVWDIRHALDPEPGSAKKKP